MEAPKIQYRKTTTSLKSLQASSAASVRFCSLTSPFYNATCGERADLGKQSASTSPAKAGETHRLSPSHEQAAASYEAGQERTWSLQTQRDCDSFCQCNKLELQVSVLPSPTPRFELRVSFCGEDSRGHHICSYYGCTDYLPGENPIRCPHT